MTHTNAVMKNNKNNKIKYLLEHAPRKNWAKSCCKRKIDKRWLANIQKSFIIRIIINFACVFYTFLYNITCRERFFLSERNKTKTKNVAWKKLHIGYANSVRCNEIIHNAKIQLKPYKNPQSQHKRNNKNSHRREKKMYSNTIIQKTRLWCTLHRQSHSTYNRWWNGSVKSKNYGTTTETYVNYVRCM